MTDLNKFKKYSISKSRNGNKITYLARVGKQNELIGRANSRKELESLMNELSEQFEVELEAKKNPKVSGEEELKKKSGGKKLPLWKPGGATKKNKTKKTSGTSGNKSTVETSEESLD
jgi:hypothetical protein